MQFYNSYIINSRSIHVTCRYYNFISLTIALHFVFFSVAFFLQGIFQALFKGPVTSCCRMAWIYKRSACALVLGMRCSMGSLKRLQVLDKRLFLCKCYFKKCRNRRYLINELLQWKKSMSRITLRHTIDKSIIIHVHTTKKNCINPTYIKYTINSNVHYMFQSILSQAQHWL